MSNSFDETVEKYTSGLDNPYVSGALIVFLVAYTSMAAPSLPPFVAKLFDYTAVKFLMFFLVAYISKRNATVALVAALALMITIITLNQIKLGKEMMAVVENEKSCGYKTCPCRQEHAQELNEQPRSESPITQEGRLVVVEAKRAEQEGRVSREEVKVVAEKVAEAEARQEPVLMAKSERGSRQMEEVVRAEKEGALRPEEARVMAAKVVVEENVNKMRAEGRSQSEQRAEAEMMPQVENRASMTELAQEVLRRKKSEESRNGKEASPSELKSICADVLSTYKSNCKMCEESAVMGQIPGLDMEDPQYADA